MAPYLSRRYIVVKVLLGGLSYLVSPSNDPSGKAKVRHYDELERAELQNYSWHSVPHDAVTPEAEENQGEIAQDVRRSGRIRRPPQRLQVDPQNIRYESEEEEYWDHSEHEESVEEFSSLSDYEDEYKRLFI